MTREEELDWLCRLRSVIYVYMPKEWIISMNKALDMAIKALEQEPSGDLISRQAVLDLVADYDLSMGQVVRGIHALPSVNQEPKTGHWIVDGSVDCYLDKVRCHCSECGKKKEFPADYDHIKHKLSISYQYSEFIDNYCPNCGAKMESEE